MIFRFSRNIGRYFCSNRSKRILFDDIKHKPVTNFKEAYDLIDGAYENKYKLAYPKIKQMIEKTERILFHAEPNYKFIRLYLILSKFKMIDNFQRKLFVQKITRSLDKLPNQPLINALYFLITNCPFFELSAIEDYSLRLLDISRNVGARSFNEYLFGMKTDFILKFLGHTTQLRQIPKNIQNQDVGRILVFPYLLTELHPLNQQIFDKVQKLLYIFLQHQYSTYISVQSRTNQQDIFIHDSTTYQDLCLLYEILAKMQFQSEVQQKINTVFKRKMYESEIDFMSAVRILKQIIPLKHIQAFSSIRKTLLDVIWSTQKDQLVNLPIKCIVQLLNLIDKGSFRDEMMEKLQRVIPKMDIYEEQVREIAKLYEGREVSEQMKKLIKNQ